LHTLSTLCSIDFELRHTFSPRVPPAARPSHPTARLPARPATRDLGAANFADARIARVEMQLKRPYFPNHAREFRFTENFADQFF
jgi:hypothetical protein